MHVNPSQHLTLLHNEVTCKEEEGQEERSEAPCIIYIDKDTVTTITYLNLWLRRGLSRSRFPDLRLGAAAAFTNRGLDPGAVWTSRPVVHELEDSLS
jgi:hypothetical protein